MVDVLKFNCIYYNMFLNFIQGNNLKKVTPVFKFDTMVPYSGTL
jgi:hypothetical protein